MKRKEKKMARIAYGLNTIMSFCWHASLLGHKWDSFCFMLGYLETPTLLYKIMHSADTSFPTYMLAYAHL